MSITERQGHSLGYALAATAISFVGRACYVQDVTPFTALGSIVSAGLSMYFLSRLYMNDPEAVKKYQKEIRSGTLSAALKRYSVKDAIAITSHGEFREMLDREAGWESFSKFVTLYGVSAVEQMLERDVVGKGELNRAAEADVQRTDSWTQLWVSYSGQFPAAFDLGVFNSDALLAKLLREYSWVDRFGSLQPAAPPSAPAGHPLGVFRGTAEYGVWAVKSLGLTREFWKTVLATSIAAGQDSFTTLLHDRLLDLHRDGLIDVNWAQDKFVAEAQSRSWDLWTADSRCDLRKLLRSSLLLPVTVAPLFAASVPTRSCLASPTKESSIIEFALYWEDALRASPNLIPAHLHPALIVAQREYREARRQLDRAHADAKQCPSDRQKPDPVVVAKKCRDADHVFEQRCVDIHNEFARYLSPLNASATASCTIQ